MLPTIDEERFVYDPETNTLRLHHDWRSDEPVSTAITAGLAAVTNTLPTELEPLYEAVDPDALNQLFRPTATDSRHHAGGRATFEANECDVVVHATGEIEITPPDEGGG